MVTEKIKNTLYWKIAGVFFIILAILAITYFLITINTSKKYFDETTQQLNRNVAEHMLKEVSPFKNGVVDEEALGKIMHSMMAVNPNLEVYVLNPQGRILSFVVLDKDVKLNYVSIAPIKEFLAGEAKGIIYGDQPRLPGEETIFSAAEIIENNRLLGYVYLTLNSEKNQKITDTLQGSYMLKIGIKYFTISFIAAVLISLMLLWVLIKNLTKIIVMTKEFQEGALDSRIDVVGNNEIARMSVAINNMADTIVSNIERLKEVDHLRRELIANISHDLRTPVSIIQGYAETLVIKSDLITKEKQDEYLSIIIKTSEKLKVLMADLFELSKLEAKQIKPQKQQFQIFDLLQDMSKGFKLLANENDIKLNTFYDQNLPMVYADLAMMERVIQNLVENAIRYTPEQGEINVFLKRRNEKVEISITNTGNGIANDDIPKIFNRYYKSNNHKNNNSTGLGLAIVKNILVLHDTDIQVKSEQDKLTTFSFVL